MKISKTIKALVLSGIIAINSPIVFANEEIEKEPIEIEQKQEVSVISNLSLETAISEAVKNSPTIRNSDFEIRLKEIALEEAKYDEKKYDKGKGDTYNFKAQMVDGTIQGFQLEANMSSKSADYALQEEKIKKEYQVQDITYNVTNAYYGALQARNALNVTKDNLDNVQKNRDMVAKKLELGVASKSELLMSDIALNEAKVKVENANDSYKVAIRALNMIMDYPLNADITLTSDFKENDFSSDVENDIENAYKTRFDMISLNHSYDLVKLDYDTNAKIYPANTFMRMTKEQNMSKIEQSIEDAKKSVEFDIRSKYDTIENSKKQIEMARVNIERAKEGLRLKELSYNSGMATSLEVSEVTNSLYNANLGLANAISNYNMAILNYDKAVNIGTVR